MELFHQNKGQKKGIFPFYAITNLKKSEKYRVIVRFSKSKIINLGNRRKNCNFAC